MRSPLGRSTRTDCSENFSSACARYGARATPAPGLAGFLAARPANCVSQAGIGLFDRREKHHNDRRSSEWYAVIAILYAAGWRRNLLRRRRGAPQLAPRHSTTLRGKQWQVVARLILEERPVSPPTSFTRIPGRSCNAAFTRALSRRSAARIIEGPAKRLRRQAHRRAPRHGRKGHREANRRGSNGAFTFGSLLPA